MNIQKIWTLIKKSFSEWSEDKASRLAAALAYYTIFSIPPLLVLVIAIAGQIFGREVAQQELLNQIGSVMGAEGRTAIEGILESADQPQGNALTIAFGLILLFFGASGVFAQLQDGLNTVWDVMAEPGRGILSTIKTRFLSFTMVLGTGFLLLVSLVISAALAVLDQYLTNLFPGAELLMRLLNFVVSLGVITVLFALIFKIVPDVEIQWKDIWIGAIVTSLLFALGRFVISLYLEYSDPTSTYGAAGSLILILLWVYYSAQILFFGAEFTQVQANLYGERLRPERGAVFITEQARATQGIPNAATKQQATEQAGQPAASGVVKANQASSVQRYTDNPARAGSYSRSVSERPGEASSLVKALEKLFYSVMVIPAVILGAWRVWRKQ
jgi:membrane protein